MSRDNRYFEFTQPIRWFRGVGMSPSNVHVGRSRLVNRVHEPTIVRPGDQVHALVGGTFVVRADGSVESGCLRLPKPALEKSYGGMSSDADLLGMMARAGACREVEAPSKRPDYVSHSRAVLANALPEYLGHVVAGAHAPSPLLGDLAGALAAAGMPGALADVGARWTKADVGQGRNAEGLDCSIDLVFADGGRLEVRTSPTAATVWVVDMSGRFGSALAEDPEARGMTEPEFRNDAVTIVPRDRLDGLADLLVEFVGNDRRLDARTAPAPAA